MPDILWQLDNFSPGIHTKPGEVRGGELYAANIDNLSVNENAWLELRSSLEDVGPFKASVTGVASTSDFIFTLHNNGELYFRRKDDLSRATIINGTDGDLSGRISVISSFRDYAIITSEGGDQGYWIDLREGEVIFARPLGIDKPVASAFSAHKIPTQDELGNSSIATTEFGGPLAFVAYAITYARQFESVVGEDPPDELFNGMESELSDPKGFVLRRVDSDGGLSSMYEAVSLGFEDNEGISEQVTGINVYRSAAIIQDRHAIEFDEIHEKFISDPNDLDLAGLGFRKIAYIPRSDWDDPFVVGFYALRDENVILQSGDPDSDVDTFRNYYSTVELTIVPVPGFTSTFFEVVPVTPIPPGGSLGVGGSITIYGEHSPDRFIYSQPADPASGAAYLPPRPESVYNYIWSEGDRPYVNTRLPSEVTQITEYNTRIFGVTGDRLVYSDVFAGLLRPWSFPESNEVRRSRPGRIDFCASYRESLLFGGRDGLFRLVGFDESNFATDDIGGQGPVDGYAWGITQNSFAYLGESGFFVTDSSSVELISDLVLDSFFRNKEIVHGSVLFLSDDAILFSAELKDLSTNEVDGHVFILDDGRWTHWPGLKIGQSAILSDTRSRFFFSGTNHLQELEWNRGAGEDLLLGWAWESNWIKGTSGRVSNTKKRFREFLISASGGVDITLKTWVDNDDNYNEKSFTTRDDLYFQRIPLERRGERIRFRIEGTGPITIRGLRIDGRL